MSNVAIIGTAGRDKTIVMTKYHWLWMTNVAKLMVGKDDILVSGGAAWADHLAVFLFNHGYCKGLMLHLPAPLVDGRYAGGSSTAGAVSNWYHDRFSKVIEEDTLGQLVIAEKAAIGTYEPVSKGYQAFFTRNAIVARNSNEMIAFTFGEGDVPADGGTKNTWDQFSGKKQHVPIPRSMDANDWARESSRLCFVATQLEATRQVALEFQQQELIEQPIEWARHGVSGRKGYECSSQGDARFSAFQARLKDGRTIEEHYQCDIKGYDIGGTNWRLGKGKPPLHRSDPLDLFGAYLNLWVEWAADHKQWMDELRIAAKEHGYLLTDKFATTKVNQAHALSVILNNQ